VTIREATIADAFRLSELMGELGYPTKVDQMRKRLESILDDWPYRTLIAETNGQITGMVGVRVDHGYEYDGLQGRILALVVEARLRGQGVGRSLVAAAEQWALERGATKIMVNTANHRAGTHEFYRSLGYDANGLRFVKRLGSTR